MSADHEVVSYDIEGGVATIRLNRPEAMNGLDFAAKHALLAAVRAAAEDDAVRCVVLTGTGRAFCVGQDLKQHIEILNSGTPAALFTTVEEHYNPIVTALATMPKPVVAAVNGVAAGAGMSLAMAADIRICADSAGFNTAFAGVALSCDTGASWLLPRLVGRSKAMDLLYFPRTISAADAVQMGLATEVVSGDDFAQRVQEVAQRLAAGPTKAYASIRSAVAFSASHTFEESLAHEGTLMTVTGSTADHRRAVDAFVAKQTPVFEGR